MSRRWAVPAAALAAMTMMLGGTLRAHHAFAAEFDAKKPVMLKGTVTKIELINPHSWLHVDVKDPKTGKVTNWSVEMGAPNQLLRRGWNKNTLPVSTEVIVDGYAAKNGSNLANGGTITFGDGRKITVSSIGSGAPAPKK